MNDLYSNGIKHYPHTLRFIHITAKNVIGILNRVASLMRRRRYNMEEVSVSFDDTGLAHIIVAVDGEVLDVEQVMHQIIKLHDVVDAYDATHLTDKLFTAIYVTVKDKKIFETFPEPVLKIVEDDKDGFTGIFSISLGKTAAFIEFLHAHKYPFIRRVMSIL